ncbi:MAG: phosphoribosylanthranilate isomerase [Gammaproteobacteria bacterium]
MSSRVRTKICGITRSGDAAAAVASGADALGFVFFATSPRHVTAAQAADIIRGLPPFVTTVGLFVNASEREVRAVLDVVPLSLLQFHGDEDNAFCSRFGRPWIKALAMKPAQDTMATIAAYPDASGILLDAWHPDLRGGTGHSFDWTTFPSQAGKPLILAGGLTPDNVGQAILQTCPYAVDVSGGVEQAKGIKDARLIAAFLAEVRKAEEHMPGVAAE